MTVRALGTSDVPMESELNESKKRNESLCAVAYTLKKYVRKPKGSPPGQVVIQREKVILVRPEL